MIPLVRHLAFALLLPFTSACTTYLDAANVKFVAVSNDARRRGKSLGPVKGQDCATKVFGIGRSIQTLTVRSALARAQKKRRFSYLNNFRIQPDDIDILMYSRRCLNVTGEARK